MELSQPDFGNLFVNAMEVCKVNSAAMLLETGAASSQQGCIEAQVECG